LTDDLPGDRADRPHWLQSLRKPVTGLFPVVLLILVRVVHWPAPGWSLRIGGALAIALGEALRAWAAGHLVKLDQLTASGPFAHVRNPLYLGSALIGAGFCLLSGAWWSWPLLAGGLGLVYPVSVAGEERRLARRFGQDYLSYAAAVPRWLPRWRAHRGASARFRWRQVLANDEHLWGGSIALLALCFAILHGPV